MFTKYRLIYLVWNFQPTWYVLRSKEANKVYWFISLKSRKNNFEWSCAFVLPYLSPPWWSNSWIVYHQLFVCFLLYRCLSTEKFTVKLWFQNTVPVHTDHLSPPYSHDSLNVESSSKSLACSECIALQTESPG